jgi:hypothetical protein
MPTLTSTGRFGLQYEAPAPLDVGTGAGLVTTARRRANLSRGRLPTTPPA